MYVYIMHNDRDVMVNFEPGEYTRRMFLFFFSVSDTGGSQEKIDNNPTRSRSYDLRGLEVKCARLT